MILQTELGQVFMFLQREKVQVAGVLMNYGKHLLGHFYIEEALYFLVHILNMRVLLKGKSLQVNSLGQRLFAFKTDTFHLPLKKLQ